MGVFGFIENFFFISLGIVFGLVLLLVYHFKKRMSVAEKKSESMYGLLSTVVKEIKNIRSSFYSHPVTTSSAAPETSTAAPMSMPASQPASTPTRSISAPSQQLIQSPPKSQPEIITLELAASDIPSLPLAAGNNKIVVSEDEEEDSESGSDYDTGSDSDSETEPDSDSESESSVDAIEVENIVLEPLVELVGGTSDETTAEDLVLEVDISLPADSVVPTEFESEPIAFEDFAGSTEADNAMMSREAEAEAEAEADAEAEEPARTEPTIVESKPEKYSADNLRKMNINQLRTIAIQQGISSDTSKMKKNELISEIVSR